MEQVSKILRTLLNIYINETARIGLPERSYRFHS
jgi:hypothetical protein